jgi:hypothetical protein
VITLPAMSASSPLLCRRLVHGIPGIAPPAPAFAAALSPPLHLDALP